MVPSKVNENRNIIDHYHYWKHEAILADLDDKRHNYSVLCTNLHNDFNIATVIRNANAFLAEEVIIYGSKQWDRRGAVGTHNYNRMSYFKEDEHGNEVADEIAYIPQYGTVRSLNVGTASGIAMHEYCSKINR